MKKLLLLPLFLLLLFCAACAQEPLLTEAPGSAPGNAAPQPTDGYALAMAADYGGIDDGAFNQAVWSGLLKYAEEAGIAAQYYQPEESSNSAYLAAIAEAVTGGAQLIVCPGYGFADAVYQAQYLYPGVSFITVDCAPVSAETGDDTVEDNVYAIFYREEQAGFLAGYAAVMDGYTKLGFLGGMAVPSVIRFGTGYLQGVSYAADLLNVDVEVRYDYCGLFNDDPSVQTQAGFWYINGTQLIFSCGGALYRSVAAAAETAGTVMIGVDTDQSADSDTIITSAKKDLTDSVYQAVEAFYAGEFPGGSIANLGVAEDGVSLEIANARFQSFSSLEYYTLLGKMIENSVTVRTVEDVDTPLETLVGSHVTIILEDE